MSDTLSQVIHLLESQYNVSESLNAESTLNDTGLDSLDIINFLFTIEQDLGVKIPDEQLGEEGLNTLKDFADFIDQNR